MRLHVNSRLLALPTNIRLGWKLVGMANNLTYYDMSAIKFKDAKHQGHSLVPELLERLFALHLFLSCEPPKT